MKTQNSNYLSVVEGRWDRNHTVRSRPRPQVGREPARHLEYYSPSLVPAVEHPILLAQSPEVRSALLIHHNYAFSRATSRLETDILNPCLLDLAQGFCEVSLPEQLRFDARRIYVDEAYHALVAEDGIRALEKATGVHVIRELKPPSWDDIAEAVREFGPDSLPLVRFFFAFVLETLVSDTFTLLPDDPAVHPVVREAVGQHRDDEKIHHAFFRDAFRHLWPGLSEREKKIGAQVIPRFIRGLLSPDDSQLELILRGIGLTAAEARTVVAGSFSAPALTGDVAQAAKSTLRYCRQSGLFR